ncbi:MAG: diacylglycerol kinase family lipid kinase [Firmicutes bacterium]|nr:diacylglycerol kinase family lipid kinase [Bacillota bacterium]
MFVIVNPVAGRNRGRKVWSRIQKELHRQGLIFTTAFTEYAGHARELAAKAVASGFDTVVAVGGDGTLTEVLNGIAGSGSKLGLIPVGSGNDFARSVSIPTEIESAVQVLADGDSISVDLGQVGETYFINVAGVGFDAQVASTMAMKARWLKGTTAYIYSVLRCLLTFRPVDIRLSLDGKVRELDTLLVVVANGRYFGGGMYVAPTAEVDDGFFDVVVVEHLSVPAFLRAFPSVFQGKHLSHPRIKVYRARQVRVEPVHEQDVPAQAEGNFIGYAPKEFRIVPGAQEVIVPKAVAQSQSRAGEERALG